MPVWPSTWNCVTVVPVPAMAVRSALPTWLAVTPTSAIRLRSRIARISGWAEVGVVVDVDGAGRVAHDLLDLAGELLQRRLVVAHHPYVDRELPPLPISGDARRSVRIWMPGTSRCTRRTS